MCASIYGPPGTPRSARVGVRELRVDRNRVRPQAQGATDPLGIADEGSPLLHAPLTERGRRSVSGPEDGTSLYGVPTHPLRPTGRRPVPPPHSGELLQEPAFAHLRRVPEPGSTTLMREPALPRLVRAAPNARVEAQEGLRIVHGLPSQECRVGEVVFGGSPQESASAEFERLLGGAAGFVGSTDAPHGIKVFPDDRARRSDEEAHLVGRRLCEGSSGQPSTRVQAALNQPSSEAWAPSSPRYPSEQAFARVAAQPAAGRQPLPEWRPEDRRHFGQLVLGSSVEDLFLGRTPRGGNKLDVVGDPYLGLAGHRDAGEAAHVGRHVYPGAAVSASRADEVLFGHDIDLSNSSGGAYEALFQGAAGRGAALHPGGRVESQMSRHAGPLRQ